MRETSGTSAAKAAFGRIRSSEAHGSGQAFFLSEMEPSATVNGSSAGSSVFPGAVGPMHAPSATADDQFAQTTAGRQVCSVTGLFPWFLPFFRPAGRPLLQYRNPEPSPLPWIPGKQRPGQTTAAGPSFRAETAEWLLLRTASFPARRSPAPAKAPPGLRAPFYQSQREHFRCKSMSSPESHTCWQEGNMYANPHKAGTRCSCYAGVAPFPFRGGSCFSEHPSY